MTLIGLPGEQGCSRLGIVAPRRLGNAVRRNLIKRLVRELFRHEKPIPVTDLVVLPFRDFPDASFSSLQSDYHRTLLRQRRAPGGPNSLNWSSGVTVGSSNTERVTSRTFIQRPGRNSSGFRATTPGSTGGCQTQTACARLAAIGSGKTRCPCSQRTDHPGWRGRPPG